MWSLEMEKPKKTTNFTRKKPAHIRKKPANTRKFKKDGFWISKIPWDLRVMLANNSKREEKMR